MSRISYSVMLGVIILALLIIFGCSSGGINPADPVDEPPQIVQERDPGGERMLLGIWELSFDASTMEITPTPSRYADAHYNITNMVLPPKCYDCLEVVVKSFNSLTRILDVDVTLTNQYQVTGYDARGILFTNTYGHELTNPDDWTPLWDIPGGEDINPFKAFAKNLGQRLFISGAAHTENYLIHMPEPPVWSGITYAIDISYPNHCKDPYSIENFKQLGVLSDNTGSSVDLQVDVFDWQNDLQSVRISVPAITGEEYTDFSYMSGDTWELELTNSSGATQGEYQAQLIATSENAGGVALYDWITITVADTIYENPIDITPAWLNFSPGDVYKTDDYAYVAGRFNGLHIFNVSDPLNPLWTGRLESPSEVISVTADGGYAYAVLRNQGIAIVDAGIPDAPSFVNGVYGMSKAQDVAVADGYAYVADGSNGLRVVDVDPPGSAVTVHTIDTANFKRVTVTDGYAFALTLDNNLAIINITVPGAAYIANTVAIPQGDVQYLDVKNGMAVVSSNTDYYPYANIYLIDVSDPLSANVTKGVSCWYVAGVGIGDGYAYACTYQGLLVIDIDPPSSASVVKTLAINWDSSNISVDDGFAYVVDPSCGIRVIDVSTPGDAFLAASMMTPVQPLTVHESDGIVYLGGFQTDAMIIDVDPIESTSILSHFWLPWVLGIAQSGEHVYFANVNNGLEIFDVVPPEAAASVRNMELYVGRGVDVSGDYVYLTTTGNGFSIIDITTPSEAAIIKDIDLDGEKWAVQVQDGYAYVANGLDGLSIIDIDPPEDADIINTVPIPGNASDVVVSGEYAYLACNEEGITIVDIFPPDEAHVVNTVDIPGYSRKIALDGSHAFIASNQGLHIAVVAPVESAHLFKTYDEYTDIRDVFISGDLAYMAQYEGGLRIIQLK